MGSFPELSKPVQVHNQESEKANRMGYRLGTWQHIKQNRLAMASVIALLLLVILACFGPYLSGYRYDEQDLSMVNQAPSLTHWFGTDALGRDLFTRTWYGARISLAIGLVTSFICLVVGVIYGGISGFIGGWVDEVMMRVVEVLYSIPFLLYCILLTILLGPGLKGIFIALGAVYWLNLARIVRGQVLILKEQEYVLAARLMGAGTFRILFRHILPNATGPILVTMTLLIPEAIFAEAFLSFLGLGVSAPMASWGVLASEGLEGVRNYPWQLFFPSFFICLTILAFNFTGEGLRDALDPRSGNKRRVS
ncbi:diguanylate cyclase [Desulforamulus profundi]|uniref:Diguanylate cyclase n=1 Tax=Desulforamulus profundi TaxID=1383067 RepID=A0A2C6L282_9FIRM|nr:ABC transporter permease [Desulforamulus profundi]PHJ37921.1 diguanylate cyclase [Desulforamulus profundi]